jgi:hypothetical protein
MNLVRCQDQKGETLEEFYAEMSLHDGYDGVEGGKTMLALMERLRAVPYEKPVYGLTSIGRLVLLSKDSSIPPWHVVIYAVNKKRYAVECYLHEDEAPWPGAYVRGEAESEDEILPMILSAMERSRGWE